MNIVQDIIVITPTCCSKKFNESYGEYLHTNRKVTRKERIEALIRFLNTTR